MSQLSDIYSSSLYEGDALDNFSYLEANGLNLFTSETPFSQQSLTSVPDSELLRPPPIPPTLQRVGPGRNNNWILYLEMNKEEFIKWWLQITHGRELSRKKFN